VTDLVLPGLAELDRLADEELTAATKLAQNSITEATRLLYERDMRLFTAWCDDRGLDALPATPATVARYLASLEGTLKPATIARRLASISVTHKAARLPNPVQDEGVARTWKGIVRTHGLAPRKVRAIRTATLRQLVRPLEDRLIDVRDRALLVVGMTGAFRRSEIVGIDVEHVTEDDGGLRVWVPRSKRDQEGAGALVGLPYGSHVETCPVRSWRAWLAASGVTEGPAFRGVDRHGNLSPTRLTARQVARVVQRRATAVGLPGAEFGAHSLRAGFATEAYANGRPELSIMRHGRWKTSTAMRGYVQEGGLWLDNPAAGLGL
jgi:site-specific recombinase XerD